MIVPPQRYRARCRLGEVHSADPPECLLRPVRAVHVAVLPLDGDGAVVVHLVEAANDLPKVSLAAVDGAGVPRSIAVASGEVLSKHARDLRLVGPTGVFHADVIDPFGEPVEEREVVAPW